MASSTQDEEAPHRKEEDALQQEAKTDDDKIVSSEPETSETEKNKKVEPEVKDANQEDKNMSFEVKDANQEDDSEQTLTFLTQWKAPDTPPEKIIHLSLVEQCSRPIQKQLKIRDVKKNKLSLSNTQVKNKFQQLLDESEARLGRKETKVSVYGPDGKVHEIWIGVKKSSFDLKIGWWTFVEEYGLKECCDFLTVWMFKHRVTQKLCLAIDTIRFEMIRKHVSKRISQVAFDDSDEEDVPPKNPSVLEIEEDDSEETLRFLTRWKAPETPPEKIIDRCLVEQCSRPIQKQVTTSDVKKNKLSLPRNKFQELLDESEARLGRKEARLSVYGPDGKVHGIWIGVNKKSFDLTIGWWTFVVEYGLKECCDFLTVWMFRHRDTQRLCLAVDTIRFAFTKHVSKRISQAAFEDSD